MPKRGKKAPYKKGKGGKSSKKPTPTQPEAEQPTTSSQEQAEASPPTAGPSSGVTPQTTPAPPIPPKPQVAGIPQTTPISEVRPIVLKEPSEAIKKKCAAIEKLANDIQEKCKVTPHEEELTVTETNPKKNVEELEYLVTEIKKLAQSVGYDITGVPPLPPRPKDLTVPIAFHDELPEKWPKTKIRVPHIFLHPPIDFRYHARDILSRNIKLYWPELGTHYTKILCETYEDHEKLVKYFDEKEMPYHTFGDPTRKMMKVVIKGLSRNVDLDKVKEEIIAASIPVIRLHEMNAKLERKAKFKTILVVVPESDEGKKVLRVKALFGNYVQVEPPLPKSKQCHRCQKWGHSQRFCRGKVKCVKCADEHFSNECTRDPAKEPLRCANCGGEHTASHRKCPHCPDSEEYKQGRIKKTKSKLTRKLLTQDNCP